MTTTYTYHFNDDGIFTCTLHDNNANFSFKEKKAIESLQLLDTMNFDNIQVFKHFVLLNKGNYKIRIEDLDLFALHHLDRYIPKLYGKIETSLKEYLYNEAKKKTKQNKKLNARKNIVKVTIGATLLTTFLTSMSLNGKTEELSEPLVITENFLEENNTFFNSEENTLEDSNSYSNQLIETTTESLQESNLSHSQKNVVYLNYTKTDDLIKKEHAFEKYEELAN